MNRGQESRRILMGRRARQQEPRRLVLGGRGSQQQVPFYIYAPVLGTGALVMYVYYAYLDEVPMTKRKRWIATSADWEQRLGDSQYQQLLKQFRGQILPKDHRASITVERVGAQIAKASQEFIREYGLSKKVPSTPYTYTVVRSEQANAFVLPNNHVFVLTGLFKYVKDEDDLAAILGHENAHNLARHAGERMSGSIVVQVISQILWLIDPSGFLSTIFVPTAGLLHTLPHSRQNETEADQIGIHLAALACYDPRAAKRVFKAMQEGPDGGAPPEFLSTHPSNDRRISQFDDWLPAAMNTYNRAGDWSRRRCAQVREEMRVARRIAAMNQTQPP